MIPDSYKPGISNLVRSGHFFFGWTRCSLSDIFRLLAIIFLALIPFILTMKKPGPPFGPLASHLPEFRGCVSVAR